MEYSPMNALLPNYTLFEQGRLSSHFLQGLSMQSVLFDEMFSGAGLIVPALLLTESHLLIWSSRITPRYFRRLPLLLCWLRQDFRSQHVALKYGFKECCQV